ncbi:MAG: TIGR04282 family arsenosugar biosynthesis glycosyltransferase [Gammaproteobacteria bacterium]|nr:TIGR04282 family arsenosugar biosynthesis glycosyltransferase [Gammaproteobacteria bacterium]
MDTELILFARSPVAGQAKTRMIPDLGEQGAANLAVALLEESVQRSVEAWPGTVSLRVWPDTGHECLNRIRRRYGITVAGQADGDLGAKMFAALNAAYERGVAAAVMGCDAPHCPAETLRAAHTFLARGRSVIGPSTDGGYYLIGINPPDPGCFERINWGGARVFDTTLKRAARAGIHLIVLQQLNDIDTMADLEALRESHPELVDRLLESKT